MENFYPEISGVFDCGKTVPDEVSAMEEDESNDDLGDLMVCDSGSVLIPKGLTKPNFTGWYRQSLV